MRLTGSKLKALKDNKEKHAIAHGARNQGSDDSGSLQIEDLHSCGVCDLPIETGEVIIKLPCRHGLHSGCG